MRINSHFALYDTIKNDKIQGKSPDWHFMDDLRVTVHMPLSREVLWHAYAKIPRHPARIYAISINSVHRDAVTENGVNSNIYVTAHGANRNNLPLIR